MSLGWPRVAIYVSSKFCSRYMILPGFHDDTPDAMYLDIHTLDECFSTPASKFRLNNIYTREEGGHARSVSPETAFQQVDFLYLIAGDFNPETAFQQVDLPYLIAGDFNIYNPATNPFRIFAYKEELEFTPYYDLVSQRGFRLLNTPGVYTCFPLSRSHRPRAINLAFTNPLMAPAFVAWDTRTLPSTGS